MSLGQLEYAESVWGFHPSGWPRPPRKVPDRWSDFFLRRRAVKAWRELRSVFPSIDQTSVDRYYREAASGQDVREDAGGYFLRCYEALIAQPEDVALVGFLVGRTYRDPQGFYPPVTCLWADEAFALVRIPGSRSPQVWDQNLLSWEEWEEI